MTQLEQLEQRYKKINQVILAIYLVIGIGLFVWRGAQRDLYYMFLAFVGLGMLLIPKIITLFSKVEFNEDAKMIYYLFSFFSVLFGSGMRGYYYVSWLDLALHFFAGFLFAMLGLMAFNYIKGTAMDKSREDIYILSILAILFAIAGGAVWEFYEYVLYIGFGVDAMNVLTTGVNDTMGDMLICTLGGLIMTRLIYRYYIYGKSSYLIRVLENFYHKNMLK